MGVVLNSDLNHFHKVHLWPAMTVDWQARFKLRLKEARRRRRLRLLWIVMATTNDLDLGQELAAVWGGLRKAPAPERLLILDGTWHLDAMDGVECNLRFG